MHMSKYPRALPPLIAKDVPLDGSNPIGFPLIFLSLVSTYSFSPNEFGNNVIVVVRASWNQMRVHACNVTQAQKMNTIKRNLFGQAIGLIHRPPLFLHNVLTPNRLPELLFSK